MKIHILSETFEKLAGLRSLLADLELQEDPHGIPLSIEPGEAMSIDWDGLRLNVTYTRPVEVFRALCLFKGHHSDISFKLREKAAFDRNGLMLDCSRNMAPTVETVKYLLSRMALMGLSLAMLYTEDTYEVPGEPYFGYLRGRFSQAELRELDDYADALGIEMIPCIQTLSHLNRVLHWPCYQSVRDTQITMLVDEEATYALIEKMIAAISACFRSRAPCSTGLCYLRKTGAYAHDVERYAFSECLRQLLCVRQGLSCGGGGKRQQTGRSGVLGLLCGGYRKVSPHDRIASPIRRSIGVCRRHMDLGQWHSGLCQNPQHDRKGAYSLS